ncbi:hypothetical protein [Pararhodospirillum photometricum]|nr:hypothetical protein [Pararhodospirillum photometricum]
MLSVSLLARFPACMALGLWGGLLPGLGLAQGVDSCKTAHLACVNACQSLEKDEAARTGCSARCAADRGVCEAERGLLGLSDQAQRLRGFLDGLTGDSALSLSPQQCDLAQRACEHLCRERHDGNQAAQAGCESRCAAEVVVCRAQADLRGAAPHLKENVERWNRFMEGFKDRKGSVVPPPADAPYDLPEDSVPSRPLKPGEVAL